MIEFLIDDGLKNNIKFQNEPPVEEPPNRPQKPPVEEPGDTPEPPPPVKEPPNEPGKPPVKEPPPKDPHREPPQKPPVRVRHSRIRRKEYTQKSTDIPTIPH